jgi:hypothetical protein
MEVWHCSLRLGQYNSQLFIRYFCKVCANVQLQSTHIFWGVSSLKISYPICSFSVLLMRAAFYIYYSSSYFAATYLANVCVPSKATCVTNFYLVSVTHIYSWTITLFRQVNSCNRLQICRPTTNINIYIYIYVYVYTVYLCHGSFIYIFIH